jgi:SAM-dependent methyltransferase
MEDIPAFKKANRDLWNHWSALHPKSSFYNNEAFLKSQMALHPIELELLDDIQNKDVLHLQCHFGQDTISLKTIGARSVTGIDFSKEAINQAKSLAGTCGIHATFIERDVLDVDQKLEETFDYVFASYGVVGWHHSAAAWMDAAFRYLKPGGRLVLVDFHPLLWILDDKFNQIKYPYFNTGVIKEERVGSYASDEAKKMVNYTWNHSLSELIQPILSDSNRNLLLLSEYDWSPYKLFTATEKIKGKYQIKGKEGLLPLVYALKAKKIK